MSRKIQMADVVRAHMEVRGCPVLTSNQCYEIAMSLNCQIGSPTPPQPIYDEAAELNRLFGAAREMLRIAGIANQGSNAYNRAIVNLHEAVTACAKSRAKAGEVSHE